MEPQIIMFSSIVESNNKTIRENNLEIKHRIPIGTLVEFKYDEWFEGGACRKSHARMFVAHHSRDCDGTPLYTLATKSPHLWLQDGCIDPSLVFESLNDQTQRSLNHKLMADSFYKFVRNISEERLTVIPMTEEVKRGVGALSWDE